VTDSWNRNLPAGKARAAFSREVLICILPVSASSGGRLVAMCAGREHLKEVLISTDRDSNARLTGAGKAPAHENAFSDSFQETPLPSPCIHRRPSTAIEYLCCLDAITESKTAPLIQRRLLNVA
jgi:hypothetical protein